MSPGKQLQRRALILLLILSSLIGYLEWGGANEAFLFQVEGMLILKLVTEPDTIAHPFIVLPLLSQVLLLITLFQKVPGKMLTYISIVGLGMLLVFMFAIGLMSINLKIIASTLPFMVISILTIRNFRKNTD